MHLLETMNKPYSECLKTVTQCISAAQYAVTALKIAQPLKIKSMAIANTLDKWQLYYRPWKW